MKKIPTVFKKEYDINGKYIGVIPEYDDVMDCSKVYAMTLKWDGSACAIIKGNLYKRYDIKKKRKIPEGAIFCDGYDAERYHNICWVPCDRDNPADKYFWKAFDRMLKREDWTYELIGKHVQGNPYKMDYECLKKHGDVVINPSYKFGSDPYEDYYSLKKFLRDVNIEGFVFWEVTDDGKLIAPVAKLRRRDFGFKWNS